MALLWMDSPGQWVDYTSGTTIRNSLNKAGYNEASTGWSAPTSGRFGRRTLLSTGTGAFSIYPPIAPTGASGYLGLAFLNDRWQDGWPSWYVQSAGGSTNQLRFSFDANGHFKWWRGGTLVGTSTWQFQPNLWYYFEFGWTIADAGGSIVIRANGEEVYTFSGDTAQSSSDLTWCDVAFSHYVEAIEDIYLLDGSGAMNNTFLGDLRVDVHLVNAAGDKSEWTPSAGANYQCVDEAVASETDYNESSDVGDIDLYNVEALKNAGAATIAGVAVWPMVLKTTEGSAVTKEVLKSGGTEYEHATSDYPSVTSRYIPKIHQVDPATSAAWTETNFNALQVGIKRQG